MKRHRHRKLIPMPKHVAAMTMEMIEANVSIIPVTGCWMWMSTMTPNGYGMVTFRPWRSDGRRAVFFPGFGGGSTPKPAHRLALGAAMQHYLIGGHVDHRCEHPWCVNPDHLQHVTAKENVRRSARHRSARKARQELGLPISAKVPGIKPSKHLIF